MSMVWNGDEMVARVDAASDDAAYEAMLFLLREANKTCPFEVGSLEQSGKVEPAGSGAASVTYFEIHAIPQHERTDYVHKGKGRAKWLELTMQEQQAKIQQIVADKIKEAM